MDEQRYPLAEGPAMEPVNGYFDAVNANDGSALQATLNYPHTRLAGGGIRHWDEPPAPRDIASGLENATPGWHHTYLDEAEVVQSSPDKVHFAVRFTRYNEAGEPLEVHHSFYVVTNQDGHWGIQARSSFVPTRQE